MIALRKPRPQFTFEEYLTWEENQVERHEYVDGVAHLMSGGEQAHHVVTANVFAALHRAYSEHCLVFSQGFKLRVRRLNDDRVYYPDVFVTCRPGDPRSQYNDQPCLVVEVLSPSTRRIDLAEKFDAYTGIAGLENYLVIDPLEPRIRVYRRRASWVEEYHEGLDAEVVVECGAPLVPQTLRAAELYRGAI